MVIFHPFEQERPRHTRTEAALGVMAVVEVVALGPAEEQMEGADGERVAAVHVDGLPHAEREPEPEDEGVDAQQHACDLFGGEEGGGLLLVRPRPHN